MPTLSSYVPISITGGGGISTTSYLPLTINGIIGTLATIGTGAGVPLTINGGSDTGLLSIGGYIPLVVPDIGPNGSIPLVVGPPNPSFETPAFPLSITGGTPTNYLSYMPLYLDVDDQETKYGTIPLFVQADENVYNAIPLFVQVNYGTGDIPLYIRGVGYKLINDGPFDNSGYFPYAASLNLFIKKIQAGEVFPLFLQAATGESYDSIPVSIFGVEGISTGSIPLIVFDQDESDDVPLYVRGGL